MEISKETDRDGRQGIQLFKSPVTLYNKNTQKPQMYIKKYNIQIDNPESICYNQLCMKISKMPCQG